MNLQPISDELKDDKRYLKRRRLQRLFSGQEYVNDWHSKLVFHDQPDCAERGAPQGKGVARAGRLLVNREERRKRIQLVCERDDDAVGRGRAGVVWAERLIVVGDRVGDARVLAVMKRVIATHNALQFGELADHAG